MTKSKVNAASIALAVPLAGPIFAILTFADDWFGVTRGASPNALNTTTQIVPVLVLSSLAGSAIALLPCVIGATLMAALGRGNLAMRMPVMWALAGGAMAGLPTALATDGTTAGTLAATGAICALICRWRVVWSDDHSAIVPSRQPAICVSHDT